jgi:hypothetical protein
VGNYVNRWRFLEGEMPGLDLLPELEGDKYYHPKKWTQRHRQCVALHLGGWTNKEIAEAVGWTEAKVSITINDPRAEYEKKNALSSIADVAVTVTEKLEEKSHDAFEKLADLLHAEKEETQLKAALAVLDRAGFTPIRRELKLQGEVPADPEMIAAMKRTLEESKNIKAEYRIVAAPEEDVEEADYEIVQEEDNAQGQSESFVDVMDG